jgi:hypothetical protein
LEREGIVTLHDICTEYRNRSNNKIIIEIFQTYHSIVKKIRELITSRAKMTNDVINRFPYKLNIWQKYDNIKSSDYRKRLMPNYDLNIEELLARKHNVLITTESHSNPFVALYKMTKETRLLDTQYKLLHNVYPTIYHLHKWKIKDTNLCCYCQVPDTLIHTIYDCPESASTWINLERILREVYKINIDSLTYDKILLGYSSRKDSNLNDLNTNRTLDTIILLIKRELILSRENRRVLTLNNIKQIIEKQKALEKYTYNIKQYSLRWRHFVEDS